MMVPKETKERTQKLREKAVFHVAFLRITGKQAPINGNPTFRHGSPVQLLNLNCNELVHT
jgi:hypothetical protein